MITTTDIRTSAKDVQALFECSGLFHKDTREHLDWFNPFLLHTFKDGKLEIQRILDPRWLLHHPDDSHVLVKWEGKTRSDYFMFTVGQYRQYKAKDEQQRSREAQRKRRQDEEDRKQKLEAYKREKRERKFAQNKEIFEQLTQAGKCVCFDCGWTGESADIEREETDDRIIEREVCPVCKNRAIFAKTGFSRSTSRPKKGGLAVSVTCRPFFSASERNETYRKWVGTFVKK